MDWGHGEQAKYSPLDVIAWSTNLFYYLWMCTPLKGGNWVLTVIHSTVIPRTSGDNIHLCFCPPIESLC
jgi:hypothetical protein